MTATAAPKQWLQEAHAAWLAGNKNVAIDTVLHALNQCKGRKPLDWVLQLAYYVYLLGDARGAAHFLEMVRPDYPKHPELLRNLAVCLSRSGQHAAAIPHLQNLLSTKPDDYVALDSLTACFFEVGKSAEAERAGTLAITTKDHQVNFTDVKWQLPSERPSTWLERRGGVNVIAFSLWGSKHRYLRGALDNAMAASSVYPGWTLRFYVDESVPLELRLALEECGSQVVLEPLHQPDRMRLSWRFKVANDAQVGRFLVRDVDSVINGREYAAVEQWIQSGSWFHVMRDWWTHTDLMLAGMWGGVAGVLPPLQQMLMEYRPKTMETPNIDQWFLRDCVWGYVRRSCLVHDRCFSPPGATRWPTDGVTGNMHVGQDVYAVASKQQAERLATWLRRLKCLQ